MNIFLNYSDILSGKKEGLCSFFQACDKEEINASLTRSMRDSDRYRRLKKSGASTEKKSIAFSILKPKCRSSPTME